MRLIIQQLLQSHEVFVHLSFTRSASCCPTPGSSQPPVTSAQGIESPLTAEPQTTVIHMAFGGGTGHKYQHSPASSRHSKIMDPDMALSGNMSLESPWPQVAEQATHIDVAPQ